MLTLNKLIILTALAISSNIQADELILSADEAFQPSYTSTSNGNVFVQFKIADGYKLYNNMFEVDSNANIIEISEGTNENDEFLGNVTVSKNIATLLIDKGNVSKREFNLFYQGCKDKVICYPVQQAIIHY
ncbi:protein-disulfide reductase DsbD N-terminal domain-containing protein [Psychromonas sp. SP041]|uniref:protein-disulfide reductase DsbD N-terminal domain-containing protein n=1 Tax=Psychromonas sp. SP041 TaxID=1365007 RepID=UPI00046FE61D|nr:protein-disulfide reductase DsbD N-terminal domain-containing protein [Psychromonas sp. SP041]